ncbi:MAG TPA: hypothetical protein VIW03_00815 [Anaeromyxobacter sp.]
MGITLLSAGADEVTCAWKVAEEHHPGYGIVQGGVQNLVAQGRVRLLCIDEEHLPG